jgi:dolichyl-phosphate beta-glucosyltransferase
VNTPPCVHLSVIIPAYNEELRLPRTLSHCTGYLESQPYSSEIIVVDDGSTDNTRGVVKEQRSSQLSVKLLSHPDGTNHGKGASVKLGMMRAQGEYRLFMDADNSTTLDQVAGFWPFVESGCQVVIGSRGLKNSKIGLRQARYKELAGRIGNRIIRALAIPGIHDTQAGFKLFTANAAAAVFPRATIDRWGSDVEQIVIARVHRCRVCEAPITWINASGSNVRLGAYLQVLREVLQIRRNLRSGKYE